MIIKPDMIPDEVVDHVWKRCECVRRFDAREAIAAAINAWPNSKNVTEYFLCDSDHFGPALILPVTKEKTDE